MGFPKAQSWVFFSFLFNSTLSLEHSHLVDGFECPLLCQDTPAFVSPALTSTLNFTFVYLVSCWASAQMSEKHCKLSIARTEILVPQPPFLLTFHSSPCFLPRNLHYPPFSCSGQKCSCHFSLILSIAVLPLPHPVPH